MTRKAAADFLIRTVLDEAFRELATTDPQRAFEGYDLSEEEQSILRGRDDRLLGLLGQAVARPEAVGEQAAKQEPPQPHGTPLPTLPEVKLLLRLAPHAVQQPDSLSEVAYAASLHPWPGDQEPKGAATDGANQSEGENTAAQSEIAWVIRISPTVVEAQEAGLKVSYVASIHPLAAGEEEEQPSAQAPVRTLTNAPWNHHTESSAAKAAANAVLAGDPSERYQKLLDLIQAVQTGDHRG
ncbi:MAG TPA: hypothetical protein VM243_15470 [Phycisphaerae bacterium]|nr:hypothetical protein [Phycisphaerae bacterium]